MKKLKIGRMCFVDIKKDEGIIDHARWVEFIESHKEYFTWYEDTENGIKARNTIDQAPESDREWWLYRLSKNVVYCNKILCDHPADYIIKYDDDTNQISVSLDKKMTIKIAAVLFKLAEFLDAKIYIDETKEFYSIEQLN